jgi:hypothetical protein
MKEIPLTQGKVALVDDEDFEWLDQWKWCLSYKDGYAVRANRPYSKIYMHTEILKTPPELVCDHINRNPLDNRRCNLRACARTVNQHNRGMQANNKSGYKGVSYVSNIQKRVKRWLAQIGKNHEHHCIGYYNTPEEAAHAYDKAAIKLYGNTADINFPTQETL